MQFFEREMLRYLWVLPAIIVLFVLARRYRQNLCKEFALEKSFKRISTETSEFKRRMRAVFILLGLVFLILALARPQWGEEIRVIKRRGVDILFVVDTSLSMLVEDVKPNRLAVAKREMRNFLGKLKGDRIGMVAFAGSAFLQVPLTVDYAAFKLFLDAIDVGYIPRAGSSLKVGLVSAVQAFKEGKDEQRVIVVLSDGESHTAEGDELIEQMRQSKVKVYAIGIGTKKGGPIPLRSEGKHLGGYKKDQKGETIISKLEDEFLKKLTKETGGLYYPATASGREVDLIYEDIQKLGKKELSEQERIQREDHFQLFLAIGLVVLALETIISERKGILAA